MNVLRKDIDAVNALLTVQIAKEDYSEKVEKTLRDYRKKANIPGFRPGMVPVGLVKKMYGKAILAEEVNKVLSDALFGYIKDNNIDIIGEPLPNETEQKEMDFDVDENFEFVFDVAIAPVLDLTLDKKTKIKYYDITVSPEMIEEQIKSYTGRFGTYEQEDVVEEKDVLKGVVKEVSGSVSAEGAVLCPAYMKDDKQKKLFIGAKKGDKIKFSVQTAYENNETEIASFLKINKDQVKNLTSEFEFTIEGITRYMEAKIDQTLFDKAFGENVVKTEVEFRAKIEEGLKESLKGHSDYKFALDAKQILTKKLEKVVFPEAFLKRWVVAANKNMTAEIVEKDFPQLLDELKWQVVSDKIAKDNALKVEQTDVEAQAKMVTKAQFAQYGMTNIPDDVLENYSKEMLKKDNTVKNLIEKALEDKILNVIKESVKLENEPISMEDFGKMLEKK